MVSLAHLKLHPNSISVSSAIFAGLTVVASRQMDHVMKVSVGDTYGLILITRLPEVILEGNRLCYANDSALVTMEYHILTPKITPSRGPANLPASSLDSSDLRLKLHSYLICHFATIHWSERQTHTQSNRWLEGMSDDCRPLLLYRE